MILGGLFLILVLLSMCVVVDSSPEQKKRDFEKNIAGLKFSIGNQKTTMEKLALRIQVLSMLNEDSFESIKKVQGAAGVDALKGYSPRLSFYWIQEKPPVDVYAELQYENDGITKSIYAEVGENGNLTLYNKFTLYLNKPTRFPTGIMRLCNGSGTHCVPISINSIFSPI